MILLLQTAIINRTIVPARRCVYTDNRRLDLFTLMVVRSSISHAPARQHLLVTVAWTALRIFYSRRKGARLMRPYDPRAQFGQMKVRVTKRRRSLRKDSHYPYTCATSRHKLWRCDSIENIEKRRVNSQNPECRNATLDECTVA